MLFIRQVYVMRCFPVIIGLISFLPVAVQGKHHLTGSEGPIKAQVGSDVVLPCNVKPPADMRDAVVEWVFNSSKTVHLFRNEADEPESQDESYKGRTSLNHKMLEHGNISLTLANVTKNDAGIYRCIVPRLPGLSEKRNIILVVEKENENPDGIPGGGKGDNNNGTHPGVIAAVVVVVVVVVVGPLIITIILIKYHVVRCHRGEQNSQRRSNKSPNEEVRNDAEMEMEELQRQHHLTGSEGPIAAQVGSNPVLPCSVEPPVDMTDAVVEGKLNSGKTVHFYRSEDDDQEVQDERCIVLRQPGQDNSEKRNIILVVEKEKENPDRHSGGGKGDNNNGDDAGVNVAGGVGVVVSLILILITYCVVRRRRGKQIFPRRSNKSQNEEVRNDGGMEMEELQNPRGNGNQGDEAEPLQNQEEPN